MSTCDFKVIDYQEIRKIMKFGNPEIGSSHHVSAIILWKLGVVITFQQLFYGN